jgi:hypothetical protein
VHDQNPPMVEFFDGRYVTKYDPLGQFVSRYFIETIRDCEGGVVLDTGAEAWQITDSERRCVVIWADGVVAGTNFGRN